MQNLTSQWLGIADTSALYRLMMLYNNKIHEIRAHARHQTSIC